MEVEYKAEQVFDSRNCGKFKLIEKIISTKKIAPRWKVEFLNTGYKTEAYQANIKTGRVLDKTIVNATGKYKIGQKITKLDGDVVEVINIYKKRDNRGELRTILEVRFLENGFVTKCYPDNLFKEGRVRNLYKPTVHGVGSLGDIDDIVVKYKRISDCKEYDLWEGILRRCYQKDYEHRNKSYEDVFICDRWKRFDYFYEDIKHVDGYDLWKTWKEEHPNEKNIYELDKDTKILGSKIYSPETVQFIHKKFNAGFTSGVSSKVKQRILKDIKEGISIV